MHGFFLSFIIQEVFEKIIWDISPLLFTLLKEKKKKTKCESMNSPDQKPHVCLILFPILTGLSG